MFLSISVIPFLFNLLRLDPINATSMLLIVNLSILFLTAFIHGLKRRHSKTKLNEG
jgi:hypothetical protein